LLATSGSWGDGSSSAGIGYGDEAEHGSSAYRQAMQVRPRIYTCRM
jgi:hypothetical protein